MQRIIPHELTQKPAPSNRDAVNSLFLLGGGLLFFLVLAAGVLLFFLIRVQTGAQADLRSEIKSKADALQASEVVSSAVELQTRLENIRDVLEGHVFATNGIRFLEDIIHPQVRLDSFAFSVPNKSIVTGGVGRGFSIVSQQIEFIKRDPNVDHVVFGGLSANPQGLVDFTLEIYFKPSFVTTIMGNDFGIPVSSASVISSPVVLPPPSDLE